MVNALKKNVLNRLTASIATSALLLIAGCNNPDANTDQQQLRTARLSQPGINTDRGSRAPTDVAQFAAGLEGITDSFVRKVSHEELTISAMRNLATIDSSLTFSTTGDGRYLMASATANASPIPIPRRTSNRAWARFTADLISQARQLSPKVAALGKEAVYEAVFDGYMSRLDKHSRYWTPKQAEVLWEQLLGFGGIGINLEFTPEGVRVVKVIKGSPSAKAGLKAGDLIVGVDGVSLDARAPEQDTLKRLRGEIGSRVTLTILRQGQLVNRTLTREQVTPQTVDAAMSGNVLYLEITGFSKSTPEDVAFNIIAAKRQAGGKLGGVILDVRDNPGGLLPASTIIADLFLTKGLIVSTKGRASDANQEFKAEPEDITDGAPVVVLINGNSASAAEILAAAIQDNGRGVVVGSSSYGKGSVQTNISLPNEGRMSVTLAEFFGPAGLPLNTVGVTPALCTTSPNVAPAQRLAMLQAGTLNSPIPEATKQLRADGWAARETVRNLCPATEGIRADDLAFARALLEKPAYYTYALGLSARR